jgi:hypothetical protein
MSSGLRRGRRYAASIAAVAAFASLCGCSENPFLQSGPEPRVANCAIIRQATPTQYVCNGKVYTATKLADIRNGIAPIPAMK